MLSNAVHDMNYEDDRATGASTSKRLTSGVSSTRRSPMHKDANFRWLFTSQRRRGFLSMKLLARPTLPCSVTAGTRAPGSPNI
jgi:hypothetical protein